MRLLDILRKDLNSYNKKDNSSLIDVMLSSTNKCNL
jgi:hypothetical protein